MLFFNGFLGLLLAALWLYCLIDAITTPETAVRTLPKVVWVLIVILLFDIGAIAWLVAGRPWSAEAAQKRLPLREPAAGESGGSGGGFSWGGGSSSRSTRRVATNPDDDEEFLAGLRARVEEQRRRAAEGEDGTPGDTPA